jgi:3-phenylpropionate/trans-cinnamate dioxygenase ferredoxin reductase subunit
MARRKVDFLLVGGGVASAAAARTLREEGADGSVLLVGREIDPPYHRPPASKGYLTGSESREDAFVHAPSWYADNDVELLTRTSVLELDTQARVAKLSTKEQVEYGQALVATGAMVRRLAVDGVQLDGLHYLRALGNADAIRTDTEQAENVVLVGGSYIGCEVAASLTALGRRCTIVMLESVTLERAFGAQAGRFFHELLVERGVRIVAGDEVDRFEGEGDGDAPPRVRRVVTKAGVELPADAVVLGVGAQPDVMLARKSGLTLGDLGGVRVDDRLRTSAPGVFAAGDIAEYDSVVHGRVMRIEHEDVAEQQGRTAALNMLGADRPHDAVPYFFSDLSDWVSLEYLGPAHEWDQEVVRGAPEDGTFSRWYMQQGRLAAMLSVGRPEDLEHARRLIGGRHRIEDVSHLSDEGSDLGGVGG